MIVVVMIGFVAFQQFSSPSRDFIPVVSGPATNTVASLSAPDAINAPAPPALLSEADLMAIDVGSVERAVVGRAEWATLEFFTLDPGDIWADRVSDAFGSTLPNTVEPFGPQPEAVSYVEWVRAVWLDEQAQGEYLVTIMMRRLVAVDGTSYQRLPLEWVELRVALDERGQPSVTEWPVFADARFEGSSGELAAVELSSDVAGLSWPIAR